MSVIIPAYEPGDLLSRAIESVLGQTEADLELIVIDDGSRQSLAWVDALDDSRVRYYRQKNRGVSIARNVGVVLAKAPLVAFLDQDDEWLPEKLERQLALVGQQPDAAFWATNFDWVTAQGVTPGVPLDVTYLGLLDDQMVCLSSSLVRRNDYVAVGGQNPLLVQTQDWDLFLRLCLDGRTPAVAPQRLVRYHLHDANASLDYAMGARERFGILDLHAARARRRGDQSALRAVERGRRRTRELYGYQALDAVRAGVRRRDVGETLRHAAETARLSPGLLARGAADAVRARLPRR